MAAKRKIEWPTAVVFATTVAALAAVYILGPDHRAEIAIGVGALGSGALALMRAMLPPPAPAPVPRRRERETEAPPPGDA